MTLAFLQLPAAERRVYLDEAAARRGLSPVIIEKDFWVCWLLSVLFESSFRDAIVFKGGTSLSKVFGVINRFSEDIDLSLAPEFLGLDEPDATAALSKGQAHKWMERAEAECTTAVRDTLAPKSTRSGERAFLSGRNAVTRPPSCDVAAPRDRADGVQPPRNSVTLALRTKSGYARPS